MCKLKSAIILKDRIFMPDYDSHSDMLQELGIEDDYLGASKKFIRAELSPSDGNVFSNIDSWEFRVDQDIRPDWFDEEKCKAKMVDAVKEWAKAHIHIGIDGLRIDEKANHYIKDCKNVVICDSATVKAWGSATVFNSLYIPWKNKNKIILADNATFKDNDTKIIYQSGDWELRLVKEEKNV